MTRSKRIYVLDTNVLMHDPTALFKFEEHDVFIPMMVLEELDNGKKGHSEASRNARQVSRFLNEIIVAHGSDSIDEGVKLVRPQGLQLRSAEAIGRLMFQLKPVEVGKRFGTVLPDNQILGSILQLIEDNPGVPVVLVSKDINLRIKASICGVKAEDYENDRAIDDFNLLFTGATELAADFWDQHEGSLRSWTEKGRTFYEVRRRDDDGWYPNQFLYMPGAEEVEMKVARLDDERAVLQIGHDPVRRRETAEADAHRAVLRDVPGFGQIGLAETMQQLQVFRVVLAKQGEHAVVAHHRRRLPQQMVLQRLPVQAQGLEEWRVGIALGEAHAAHRHAHIQPQVLDEPGGAEDQCSGVARRPSRAERAVAVAVMVNPPLCVHLTQC